MALSFLMGKIILAAFVTIFAFGIAIDFTVKVFVFTCQRKLETSDETRRLQALENISKKMRFQGAGAD